MMFYYQLKRKHIKKLNTLRNSLKKTFAMSLITTSSYWN